MDKEKAIEKFGTQADLARAIGCSRASVNGWPDPLPPRIADRVIAACVRAGIDASDLLDADSREAA